MAAYRRTDSEKCWRRRPRTWIRPALFLFATGAAGAQTATEQPPTGGAARLDAFVADVSTLRADFRQELWSADHRLLQTDTGTLAIERPNRFRWVYAEPTQLTVVADGEKLWIYDVELAQVTVAPLDSTVTSSPAMLLSGDHGVAEGFDVARSYELEGLDWIKLVPRTPGSDFSSVLIGFRDALPQKLELTDGLNQVTLIDLSNLVVNPTIDDATFEFTPPKGVDVIGGEG